MLFGILHIMLKAIYTFQFLSRVQIVSCFGHFLNKGSVI